MSPTAAAGSVFAPLDSFVRRHLGSTPDEIEEMLAAVGAADLQELMSAEQYEEYIKSGE